MTGDVEATWMRVGGLAGLGMLALALVFGILGGLLVGAGEPPSGTTDPGRLTAYFGHKALAPLASWQAPGAILGLLFFFGAREAWGSGRGARQPATMALLMFGVAAPAFLVEGALVAGLVHLEGSGGDIGTWFRVYDVLYNSFLDVIMGAAVVFLSLTLRRADPRRLRLAAVGFVIGGLHGLIAFTPWVPMPGVIRAAVMMAFSVWFAFVCVALVRAGRGTAVRSSSRPASALADRA